MNNLSFQKDFTNCVYNGQEISTVPFTDLWIEEPPAKETKSSTALRKINDLRLKMKRSMSFVKCKSHAKKQEVEPSYDDSDDSDDDESYDSFDTCSKEGLERVYQKIRKQSISGPMKLQPVSVKEQQALREKRNRELAQAQTRTLCYRPSRPALRSMSTTPDLRDKNKRDSQFIEDLIDEFPVPPTGPTTKPVPRPLKSALRKPASSRSSLFKEVQERRARLTASSVINLKKNTNWAGNQTGGQPNKVLWIDRKVDETCSFRPYPEERPRFRSQPSTLSLSNAALSRKV